MRSSTKAFSALALAAVIGLGACGCQNDKDNSRDSGNNNGTRGTSGSMNGSGSSANNSNPNAARTAGDRVDAPSRSVDPSSSDTGQRDAGTSGTSNLRTRAGDAGGAISGQSSDVG